MPTKSSSTTNKTPGGSVQQKRWLTKGKVLFSIFVILPALFIGLLIVVGIVSAIQASNEEKAEQARLAADPVTVNGIYDSLNKERTTVGAPALTIVNNLTAAADQYCNDMVTNKYADIKNPISGKESNSFITDNIGDLYYKTYVGNYVTAIKSTQTANDVIAYAVKGNSINLNNPSMNSVGIAVCQPAELRDNLYVTIMADKQEKPVAPKTTVIREPVYIPPVSTYRAPTTCNTTYNTYGGYFDPTAQTTCY